MLPWTASEATTSCRPADICPTRQGILKTFSALAVTGSLAFGVAAAETAGPSPLDRLRERSADVRWQEIRSQWLPPTEAAKPSAGSAPAATENTVPLYEWIAPGSPSSQTGTPDQSAADAPVPRTERDAWQPSSAALNQIREHAPFPGDFTLTPVPGPETVQPVLVPHDDVAAGGVAATATGSPVPDIPPVPIAEETPSALPGVVRPALVVAQLQPLPLPPGPDDSATIFRPITEIEPHYDYSPTGTRPHEYLCPQPSSIPTDQRMRCPELLALPHSGTTDRSFAQIQFQWLAANLSYNPLYFEDIPLERYGQAYWAPVQPFVSVGKFGVQLIGLPYQMALHPVWREHYPLGYYRPGEPTPHLCYQIPLNAKAIAAAAGAYTGLIFLFP